MAKAKTQLSYVQHSKLGDVHVEVKGPSLFYHLLIASANIEVLQSRLES